MGKKILIVIISILITAFSFELVLHITGFPEREHLFKIGWNSKDVHPELEFVNQLGFRGQKFNSRQPGERVILLIGDSQVEAMGLPDRYMMEALLEKKLNALQDTVKYRCYSIGSGGYGQDQELLSLKRYLDQYDADEVILWFTPENDIWNNMFPTHWPWNGNMKPTFWLKDSVLQAPESGDFAKVRFTTRSRIISIAEILFHDYKTRNMDDHWSEKLPDIQPVGTTAPQDATLRIHTIGPDEHMDKGKSHYLVYLDTTTARLQYGIELTRKLLEAIADLCKEKDIRFSMFVAEGQFVADLDKKSYAYAPKDHQYYLLNKSVYLDRVCKILAPYDSRYFRLQTDWKCISTEDRNHLNFVAQQELAESLAGWILLKKESRPLRPACYDL